MIRRAPPDRDRCKADVRIGTARDDLARCMRRKVCGDYCRQHAAQFGSVPGREKHRRTQAR